MVEVSGEEEEMAKPIEVTLEEVAEVVISRDAIVSKEIEGIKKENEELKTELAAIKKLVNLNVQKLSTVKLEAPASITELQAVVADSTSNNFLNNRKSY